MSSLIVTIYTTHYQWQAFKALLRCLLTIDPDSWEWDNIVKGTRGFDRSVFWPIASRGVIALVKTVAKK